MSNFEILLSCMYENNFSILDRSNIQCSSVIINQCNVSSIVECNEKGCLWINSTDRGLSISRNMAIDKSEADVCLIADNDEVFDSDVEKKVFTINLSPLILTFKYVKNIEAKIETIYISIILLFA